MATVEVNRAINAQDVAAKAADYCLDQLLNLQEGKTVVNFALTGGTVGILTLKAIAENSKVNQLDLNKIHFWFGDERYVNHDSPDRNANQAREALLSKLQVSDSNIHEFPASDSGLSVQVASKQFETSIVKHFGEEKPFMDLMLLGMGPDGHVASLFPTHTYPDTLIVAEEDSPKPPPQRLSMSMEMINSSTDIVFVVSGVDKAAVIEQVHKDPECDLPAAKVSARDKTLWIIDEAAGAAFWSC